MYTWRDERGDAPTESTEHELACIDTYTNIITDVKTHNARKHIVYACITV